MNSSSAIAKAEGDASADSGKACMDAWAVAGWVLQDTCWDCEFWVDLGSDSVIGDFASHHDNGKEDRRFSIGKSKVTQSYMNNSDSYWTGYVNDWDQHSTAMCKSDYVMSGVRSYHDNKKEDRRWNIECKKINTGTGMWAQLSNSWATDWVNDWDRSFHQHQPVHDKWIMAGIESYHSDKKEDRRFRFHYKKFCHGR